MKLGVSDDENIEIFILSFYVGFQFIKRHTVTCYKKSTFNVLHKDQSLNFNT